MDKLFTVAKYYADELENKRFLLIAGKKGKKLELEILFNASHFHHLAGLHKLIDLPNIQRKSEIIYRQILDKKISYEDIKKSAFILQSDERLDCFLEIYNVLFSKEVMKQALKGEFKGVKAEVLLSKKEEVANLHLFLKRDKGIWLPCSFFREKGDSYLQYSDAVRWSILEVKELSSQPNKAKNNQVRNTSYPTKIYIDRTTAIIETQGERAESCRSEKGEKKQK